MGDLRPSWQTQDEEEEEEELDENNYTTSNDAILFAIEVSSSMLAIPPEADDKKAEKDSPALAAIKCAYQIMTQRIISSPKDMMGVLLFGTEKSKFQEDNSHSRGNITYPHCYLLSDLGIPSAKGVKQLRAISDGTDNAAGILAPSEEPVSMANMLFCANQIFTTKAPNFGSRRLFIITDQDEPHATDKPARSQATVRAKDLYDLGVTIELFPISHPDHEFDRSKFYDDIIYRDPADGGDLPLAQTKLKSSGGGISLLKSLTSDINSKQVAKRALFSGLPFEIGPGLTISVKGYNLLQKQQPARSCYIYEKGEELQMAVGVSEQVNADTSRRIESSEIKKAYKFGGTQVLFTAEEQLKLKFFESPVLRIIGFKPQMMLPIWASVQKATFIYPSENGYTGSTRTFAALWQKLLKDKIMGLAWFIARKNAKPLIVAILPSAERIDETTGAQVVPQGLWLYPLPFADDIRENPTKAKPFDAPDNLVDEMRKVVKQLQLPKAIYDPTKYSNPQLQTFYKWLQIIALDDDAPPDDEPLVNDTTIPKYRQINKRAGEYIQNWGLALAEHATAYTKAHYDDVGGTRLKRVSEDDGDGAGRKRIKTEKTGLGGLSNAQLNMLIGSGGLGKYTIPELKDFMHTKGLSSAGKKADLVERVEAWVEGNC